MIRPSQASFPEHDRFDVLSELGSGGMGIVYAVYDRQRGEKLALKTLQGEDPGALLRLKNEFRALQDLQHPNLVALGELFHDHDQWFFTMELIEGVDLISHVRKQGILAITGEANEVGLDEDGRSRTASHSRKVELTGDDVPVHGGPSFDEDRIRACLAQLAEGLAAIHAAGRVHRDIKPGNVLVEPAGRLVVLDFGLVTQPEFGQKSAEHFFPLGTIDYMAPEQAASKDLSPATDWYSVGVMLFEALTGQLPFSGGALKVLTDKQLTAPRRPSDVVPGVPPDLDDLCVSLLDRDPERRPGAEQVLRVARHGHPGHRARRASSAVLPTRTFVGRQRELALLFEAYAAVVGGKPSSVLVRGYSGLGKSELLRTFVRQLIAREPGAMALHGRCYERESVPYKALDEVVDSLSQQLEGRSSTALAGLVPANVSLLLRLFPVLGRVPCFRDAPATRFEVEDLQEVRSLAFRALRELLVRLADTQVLVVTIDDLQWADEDSKKLLRVLLQPPEAPKLLLLAAMRTAGEPAASELFEGFPEPPEVVELGPLTAEESRKLAKALAPKQVPTGESPSQRLDQIARESAGHPLFIRELVQHARGLRVEDAEAMGAGLRLDDALWARICELDRGARDLVELVAVAASPLTQRVVAGAVGVGEAEMFRLAGRLRTARLVRTGGPSLDHTIEAYHDRVREAVLAKTENTRIRAWHDALATAMIAGGGAEPERLAFHLESAGRPDEAAQYAVEAAERAAGTLAFKRASELYRRALENWPEPRTSAQAETVRQLRVKLGEALANAGRGPESAQAYQLAVTGASCTEALELKRRCAEQLLRSGHVELGLHVVEEVLATLGARLPRSTVGSLLSLLWQRLRLRMRGLGFRVQEPSCLPAHALIEADVCNAISQGLAMIDTVRGAYFSTRFVGLALNLGERSRVLRALWMEASYAANTGLPASYVAKLHAAMESLVDDREPLTRAYVQSAQGCASFMRGDWADALARFESTDHVFTSRGGSVWERTSFRFFVLWSLYYLGELAELTRRVMPLHADAVDRGDRYAASGTFLGLANVAHLNVHGADATRRTIREATDSWSRDRYYLRDYYAFLAETQVDLYDGEAESAHRRVTANWRGLSRSLLLMIPSVRIEADHLRARAALAAAVRPGADRGPLLSEARRHERRLSRQGAPWARALALPLAAAVAFQGGDRSRAVDLLKKGIEALEGQRMRLFAAAARWRLGVLVGGDEGAVCRAEADRFFVEQGVREPDRMVAMLAPGLE
jgi:serine/threonine protein kinase